MIMSFIKPILTTKSKEYGRKQISRIVCIVAPITPPTPKKNGRAWELVRTFCTLLAIVYLFTLHKKGNKNLC